MVQEAWEADNHKVGCMGDLMQKLSRVSGCMQTWGKEIFGSVRLQIKQLKANM